VLIAIVSGARPQFIKLVPIIQEKLANESVDFYYIHTGQHYDKNMSEVFFEELSIPHTDINLDINNGTHAELVGIMLIKIEKELLRRS
jgi:UDP-N-acetylglucosamine 2-epimerase